MSFTVSSFTWLVLVMLVLDTLMEVGADWLNSRWLTKGLPEEFKDLFDAEAYQKSQKYSSAKIGFHMVQTIAMSIVLLGAWFGGFFGWVDDWVRLFGWGVLATGLAFIGVMVAVQMVISLPFSWYHTFVLEEQFGFNKTTYKTFWLDLVKGLGLGVVVGGVMFAVVQSLFEYAGPSAWWYAWIAMMVMTFGLAFVAPAWIMPLFSKFTPLEEGELKQAILQLANRLKFPHAGLYMMDGSKRSAKANAFFTGFGNKKRIVLFDTLMANHPVPELVAVLAHEIGHYKKKHMWISLAAGGIQFGWMFFLFDWLLNQPAFFFAFGFSHVSVHAGLVMYMLGSVFMSRLWSLVMNWVSRVNEFEADRYAATATGDSETMVSALKRLTRENLGNLQPHPVQVWMSYDHPPVLERIRALRALHVQTTKS